MDKRGADPHGWTRRAQAQYGHYSLEHVRMWLSTIDSNRVAVRLRTKLEHYQQEARDNGSHFGKPNLQSVFEKPGGDTSEPWV